MLRAFKAGAQIPGHGDTVKTPPQEDADSSPSVLEQEAWVWVRRLAADDVSEWDVQAARRWMARSPAHQAAFDGARRQWRLMKPSIGELLQTRPKIAARHAHALRGGPRMARRAFLGAAVGVAGVSAIAVIHPPLGLWPPLREWDADVRTATGEQQSLTLAGQVDLTLNTRSSIRHLRTEGVAGVRLLSGEAAVDLPAGSGDFAVAAGDVLCVAAAGRFEVRHLDGRIRATCLQGRLRVEYPGGVRNLQANEQWTIAGGSAAAVTRINPEVVSAWRKGELWFDQTPLWEVIDEINRYRSGRVMLLASAQRDSAVSGRFAIDALDAALLQIQHSFELKRRSLPGDVLLLT